MDPSALKSNSHASKNRPAVASNGEQKQVERKVQKKVTTGKVTTKKNEVRKFTDIFVAEDVSNVKSYLVMDVLIPAAKKLVTDIVKDGIDMLLYGESRPRDSRNRSYGNVSYSKYYDDRRDERRHSRPASTARFNFDDIIFEDRTEANTVLQGMFEILEEYDGMVSVGDMYDLAGLTCDYTAYNYGWTNLRDVKPVRCYDGGYRLDLPKAKPLR